MYSLTFIDNRGNLHKRTVSEGQIEAAVEKAENAGLFLLDMRGEE